MAGKRGPRRTGSLTVRFTATAKLGWRKFRLVTSWPLLALVLGTGDLVTPAGSSSVTTADGRGHASRLRRSMGSVHIWLVFSRVSTWSRTATCGEHLGRELWCLSR